MDLLLRLKEAIYIIFVCASEANEENFLIRFFRAKGKEGQKTEEKKQKQKQW